MLPAILALVFAAGVFGAQRAEAAQPEMVEAELNSGAGRDGDFISVNRLFTADGKSRTLVMTGLKEGNLQMRNQRKRFPSGRGK